MPSRLAPAGSPATARPDGAERLPMPAMLRGGLLATGAGLPVLALGGYLGARLPGSYGALTGGLVALAIFALGFVLMRWVLERLAPSVALAGALAVYLLQLSWLLPAMAAVTRLPGTNARAAGIGALVASVLWMAGQVWGFAHARTPLLDVALPGELR